MIKIKIKSGETIDKALKRFKKKANQIGLVQEIRERSHFEKPSATKRKAKLKAQYIQKMYGNNF